MERYGLGSDAMDLKMIDGTGGVMEVIIEAAKTI